MTPQLRVLRFDGLHPDTLGHYFAALGLLGRRRSTVGGGAGLLAGSTVPSLTRVAYRAAGEGLPARCLAADPLRAMVGGCQKADTKAKSSSELWRLRNSHSVQEVQVLEAHIVGLSRNQFNPVFGTGGTMGQRDFADVWCECLKKARPAIKPAKAVADTSTKPSTSTRKKSKAQLNSEGWLDATLVGQRHGRTTERLCRRHLVRVRQ